MSVFHDESGKKISVSVSLLFVVCNFKLLVFIYHNYSTLLRELFKPNI